MINILFYAFISMCVSLCIGIMLNARMKISIFGAVLSGLCYSVFLICGSSKLGYFLSSFILALFSELLAKRIKSPSTLFLILGIYPLVPGSGIYKTIAEIINGNYSLALKIGGDTFVYIAFMAIAIALVSIMFGKTSDERFKKGRSFKYGFESGGAFYGENNNQKNKQG